VDLNARIRRNERILDWSYYGLYISAICVLLFFISLEIHAVVTHKDFQHAYYLPRVCAILYIVVWIFLFVSTWSFIVMLNKRFGEAKFTGPKCKLIGFLSVFSLSFFVRGTWDLIAPFVSISSGASMAVLMFTVYFLTELLPIFVIYLAHY